ncbi:hypothetical protein D7X33_09700, partial [Butyricicoccus sp. 1XD8-22]
ARRAAGLCPAPAGAFAPDPEMLTHLLSPAGGTGMGELSILTAQWPARQNGGGLAGVGFWMGGALLLLYRTKSRWHYDTSGFSLLMSGFYAVRSFGAWFV